MTTAKSKISSARTVGAFLNGRACSDTLFHVLSRASGDPLELEERAAMPFAGGIMQHGYQCGMIWGATLAAGAQAYRLLGPGPQAESRAIVAAQRLAESFREQNENINCLEITHIDNSSSATQKFLYFLVKGGSIGCVRMAARYAPAAFREINCALSEVDAAAPAPPVSCSAMLAREMGVSEMHAVMAAGFAGGVGLTGGACGALGAAIWITGLKSIREGGGKIEFRDPGVTAKIDQFLKCTDCEFECSEIVGRRFADIDDHAGYLRDGGCSKIIEVLAA